MRLTIFFTILLFLLSSSSSYRPGDRPQHQFTSFTASFDWPGTFCKKMACEQSPDRFILQSLSPNADSQPGLHNHSIYHIIRDHLEELMEYWPVLYTVDANCCIAHWRVEYDLFGTACSDEFTAERYISTAITIAKVYSLNIGVALRNQKILPKEEEAYVVSEIVEAVKKHTGYIPYIVCEEIDGEYYLAQIGVCFDFTARNVKHCLGRSVFCGGISHVFYPPVYK